MPAAEETDAAAPPPPRLSAGDTEKLVQRLYYKPMELAAQREDERQATLARSRTQYNKHISKADEENLVSRMYDQQLQRFATSKEEREKKANDEMHKNDKKLPTSEIESHVHRMYEDERERSTARKAELTARYLPTAEPKKIGKEELQQCVARLSHVDWEKRDEELFEKYVYPYDVKSTKISRTNEQAMADRLCTTKGTAA